MARDAGYVSPIRYERRVTYFTSSGTFTPPAGVTYAVAHIRGGGGGIGNGTNAGAGGSSSVAFASGTVTADGGTATNFNFTGGGAPTERLKVTPPANSGQGGAMHGAWVDGASSPSKGGDGGYIVAGAAVTAGTGITVTVGAGGTAGTYSSQTGVAGATGFVWIEYMQPIGAGL